MSLTVWLSWPFKPKVCLHFVHIPKTNVKGSINFTDSTFGEVNSTLLLNDTRHVCVPQNRFSMSLLSSPHCRRSQCGQCISLQDSSGPARPWPATICLNRAGTYRLRHSVWHFNTIVPWTFYKSNNSSIASRRDVKKVVTNFDSRWDEAKARLVCTWTMEFFGTEWYDMIVNNQQTPYCVSSTK